jgi:isopentenyl phosphate kinase
VAVSNHAVQSIVFLKLGGSLITDKRREATVRGEVLERLAGEVAAALDARPDLRLVVGHGSGSFGHFAGRRYGTRNGVESQEDWLGYAEVAAAAARLNRMVIDALLAAGVPVLGIQPSASARCHNGVLTALDLGPIRAGLAHGLVPLIYGDVALDEVLGGTIISTEEILIYLARLIRPGRILLAGEVGGVLDETGAIVPLLRPRDRSVIEAELGGSYGVDVTGGMWSKVDAMLALVAEQSGLEVRIFSGVDPGQLTRMLVDPAYAAGTLLTDQRRPRSA